MADQATNNGNGTKAMIQVQEIKIDLILQNQREMKEYIEMYFGPDGICPKERSANAASLADMRAHIKGLWASITFIVGVIVTVVIEIVRKL